MTGLPAEYLYVLSIVLFILSLRWMSEVKTSRLGNWSATAGMAIAILSTLVAFQIQRTDLLVGAALVGTVLGTPIALKVPMTAVPQRTAMSHAFGSLAVALVGAAEYYQDLPKINLFTVSVLSAEMILGFLTFTGSCVAFAKLQGLIPGRPFVYRGRNVVSLSTLGAAVALGVYLSLNPTQEFVLPIMAGLALLFGLLLVLAIGGADMPTVIAILNSYAGISAAALGFVLDNKVLIVAGALDGSSGFILAVIMSKAMNRSFANVLFGGVGSRITAGTTGTTQAARSVQAYTPEDVATVLEDARSVIVVPGYGMAVAQAQHVVKELAQVPYEQLWEMDRVNPLFPETDMAIVVGANDVTNCAARTKADSPLYGMPILDVDKSRTVVFIKRSTRPGFSGVDNELFYLPNTMMVFGDAKEVLTELVASLKRRGGSRQKV
ncbi:MAG: NAD(P)(+) transhydrogenase (Re/Si-specific) subunit beta [Thaumarchaeota archaeon]|nr:MAG: NAD(P)(+) transhydrogenase (Re/Si-specific) subunit beta [Nitrososphaerota archaeon]